MFVHDLYEYSNIELLQRVRLTNPHYRTSVARLDRLSLAKYTTAIVRKRPIPYPHRTLVCPGTPIILRRYLHSES